MHGTHPALPLVHGRLRFHRVNTGGGVERERHSVNRGGQSQKSAAGLGGEKDRRRRGMLVAIAISRVGSPTIRTAA